MKKRYGYAVITIMISIFLLAGCGGKEEAKSEAPEAKKAEVEVTVSSNINPTGMPIAKEKVNLNVMAAQTSDIEDYNTNEYTKYLEDLTNIHINWSAIPQSNTREKLNVVLNTGVDLPDVFMNCSINPSQLTYYGEQGMFVDIAPYIDEYCPNIKAMFESNPVTKVLAYNNEGKIYGMPSFEETYHVKWPNKAWINKTWLEAMNLPMPTTVEEFYDTLVAFRDGDPNGNGKKDEIMLSAATTGWETNFMPFMMSAFVDSTVVNEVNGHLLMRIEDGKLLWSFDTEGWKEGLKFYNKLYNEGLLDPLAFTQTIKQLKTAASSEDNIVGVVTAGANVTFTTGFENNQRYVALPPLIGKDGQQYTKYKPINSTAGHYVITTETSEEERIAAIRLLDYFFSDEGLLNSRNGLEGRDWRYCEPDSGEVGINGKPAVYEKMLKWDKQQNAHWTKTAPGYFYDDLRNGMMADPEKDNEYLLYQESKNKYADVNSTKYILPFSVSEEHVADFVDIITALEPYVSQFYSQAITGKINIDAEWDKYLKTLKDMRAYELLDIINEAYEIQYPGALAEMCR